MSKEASSSAPENSILIVAYGNLSRRDDGVAFHVVRRLRERLGLPEGRMRRRGGG